MDRTPTTDHGLPGDDRWRAVDIASPRPLDGPTYTMIATRDGGEEIVARYVSLAQALFVALELRGGCVAGMVYRDRGDFREYVIGRRPTGANTFKPVLRGVVPRTARIAADHIRALEFFEEVMQHDPRIFFDGRLVRERAGNRNTNIGART
jgi:hypothetical protein